MNIFPSPESRLYPFNYYAEMRKNYPICYDDENDLYGIFRYKDIHNCLVNFKDFSSDFSKWLPNTMNDTTRKIQLAAPLGPSLITSDPPKHRNFRNIISPAFDPKQISMLEPEIEKITTDLIDKVIGNECMDLIQDLAYPLPVTIIADLLGVPQEDHHKFKRWADQIISLSININKNTEEVYENNYKLRNEMNDYFSSIIDLHSKYPKNDLIGELVKNSFLNLNSDNIKYSSERQQQQQKNNSFILSKEDILSFCTLLLLAGHVTTVNLIGNSFLSLFENIDQFKKLKSNPLLYINSTIEETLRYRSPVQAISRFATKNMEIGNDNEKKRISKGQRVILWIGSANHDESIFINPKQYNISRNPNNHIAFGSGVHLCIGAPLARLESQVVIKVMLKLLDDIQLTENVKQIKSLNSSFIHGVERLPISFRPNNK